MFSRLKNRRSRERGRSSLHSKQTPENLESTQTVSDTSHNNIDAEEFDWSEIETYYPFSLPQQQQQLENSCSDDLNDTLVNSSVTSSSNSSCYGIPKQPRSKARRHRRHKSRVTSSNAIATSESLLKEGVTSSSFEVRPWYEEDDELLIKVRLQDQSNDCVTSQNDDVSGETSDVSSFGEGGGVRDAEAWIEEFE